MEERKRRKRRKGSWDYKVLTIAMWARKRILGGKIIYQKDRFCPLEEGGHIPSWHKIFTATMTPLPEPAKKGGQLKVKILDWLKWNLKWIVFTQNLLRLFFSVIKQNWLKREIKCCLNSRSPEVDPEPRSPSKWIIRKVIPRETNSGEKEAGHGGERRQVRFQTKFQRRALAYRSEWSCALGAVSPFIHWLRVTLDKYHCQAPPALCPSGTVAPVVWEHLLKKICRYKLKEAKAHPSQGKSTQREREKGWGPSKRNTQSNGGVTKMPG